MARASIRGKWTMAKEKPADSFLSAQAAIIPQGLCFYILEYLKWLKMQNYSAFTIGHRRRYLIYFAKWAKDQNIEDAKKVNRATLDDYKKYLYYYKKKSGNSLSVATQWTRLEPLRSFFSWMARKYHLLYNPASELDLPRLGQTLPGQILSDKQVNAILDQPDLNTRSGIRNRTILELFYSTGMRRMELIDLKLYDINFGRMTILIRQGKGAKDRVVPLGNRAMYWLDRYINEVRPHFVKEAQNLFLTNAGDPLRPNYVTWKVRQYIEAAGVNVDGSCHIFRHSMATLMLENGADIRYIQQLLGHAKLETTQIYTKVSIEKLKEVHAKTHPAEKNNTSEVP